MEYRRDSVGNVCGYCDGREFAARLKSCPDTRPVLTAVQVRLLKGDIHAITLLRRAGLLGFDQRLVGNEHVFFAHDQVGGVEGGELEAVAVGDGVGGAGFNTVAAEDAAVVVDVVDLGVALGGRDAVLGGVLVGLDVDAVGGTGGGTEETGHALFQAVLVALQDVGAAIALLKLCAAQRARAVGVVLHLGGLEHFTEGDAHALGDAGDVTHDRHGSSIPRTGIRYQGSWIGEQAIA